MINTYKCPTCGLVSMGDMAKYCCIDGTALVAEVVAEQTPLAGLEAAFDVSQTKTLKLKMLKDYPLNDAITVATRFIRDNKKGYTRIEFPHDNLYYVVAKLKGRS